MLSGHVLVLNRLYQPVQVTSVRRAICLMVVGAAQAIDREYRLFDFASWTALSAEYHDDCVGAVNFRMRVPRVVVLQAYDRMPKGRVRFSRHNIFLRDASVCQYCNTVFARRQLNLDHVVPRSQGGKTNWENVVASCIACNFKKGCKTPEQAHMQLVRPPRKPRWAELVWPQRLPPAKLAPGQALPGRYREWLPFLNPIDASYWNCELEHDD